MKSGFLSAETNKKKKKLSKTQLLFKAIDDDDVDRVTALIQESPVILKNVHPKWVQSPLWYAIQREHYAISKILIDAGSNCNFEWEYLPLLSMAAAQAPIEVIDALLEHGANVNEVMPRDGTTALSMAVAKGRLDVVERLVAAGADPNHIDNSGRSMLAVAACGGRNCESLIKFFVELGADVNAGQQDRTPIMFAASHGNTRVMRELLKAHADVNCADTSGRTPLVHALLAQQKRTAMLLLQHGANIDPEGSKVTPLMAAAVQGIEEMIDQLIEQGARINAVDEHGRTALMLAADAGTLNSVETLLKHSPELSVTDVAGSTAMSLASMRGHLDIVRTLLAHSPTSASGVSGAKFTPLQSACYTARVAVAEELLKGGAQVDEFLGSSMVKPALIACSEGPASENTDILRLLLAHGGSANTSDEENRSALMYACKFALLEHVTLLLAEGAEINHADKQGNTPLHAAALSGNVELVTMLLDAGADPRAQNTLYMTPASVAESQQHQALAKRLQALERSRHPSSPDSESDDEHAQDAQAQSACASEHISKPESASPDMTNST